MHKHGIFGRAINAMLGNEDGRPNLVPTLPKDMKVGNSFIDGNGAIYHVEDIKDKDGTICVYATTPSPNADGWFMRDVYDVIGE